MAPISILHFDDSNMAGFEWSWSFFLNKTAGGRFTVSAKQTIRKYSAMRIAARRDLRDGVDVYEGLAAIVSEAGYSLADWDLQAISKKIAEIDATLVPEFLFGEELSEAREEQRRSEEKKYREDCLRPYREAIDRYVLRFSEIRRYGPSARGAATLFIEDYVCKHGQLPTGVHRIELEKPFGYHGGDHDFTPLAAMYSNG
jgi:hypothetical protein